MNQLPDTAGGAPFETAEPPRSAASRERLPASLWIAMIVLLAFVLVALIGPPLAHYNPVATDVVDRLRPPGSHLRDGHTAWLGTDGVGRDILAQIIVGIRTSLLVGVLTALAALIVGTLVGALAGYLGGWVNVVVTRLVDIQIAFPGIVLAIVIAGVVGRNVLTIVLALGVTRWISFARLARSSVFSLREREWVAAARVLGVPTGALIRRHLLPFLVGPTVALATLEFSYIVLAEAGLSFLGLGLPTTTVSLGQVIANGQSYLDTAWWISALPGIALSLLIICGGIVGDHATRRYALGDQP
jgi:peptide/nickel transport system permease protein